MKKFLAIILMLSLCFGLCACGGADADVQDKDEEIAEEKESENKDSELDEEAGEKTTKKEEKTTVTAVNCGVEVVTSYVYDGDVFILVKNVSDKPVLSYSVAYMTVDKNGLPTESTYSKGTSSTANIMPGEKKFSSYRGNSTDAYATAVVTNITYSDNTTWEFDKVSEWYETMKTDFTVASYNESLTKLATDAAQAETNEYVSVDSSSKNHRNQFSTSDDFDFTLTNKSSKDVVNVTVRVLEYDENGYAVSTSPWNTYCKNDRSTGGTVNLTAGSTDTFTSSLFFEAGCKQYKCAVQSVEFADGETWTNPYIFEWIIVNNKSFS